MAKQPQKFTTVTFLEQWRGHEAGAVAELTEERATELVAAGICAAGAVAADKPATSTRPKAGKPKAE